ncbi:polyprenyl diphosphate synthase [Streptomyces hygroscopicus]|uniref:polyprenyl synthetase family protein n=1 Tax=Streptomyces hygroscopicus TaxID=1912 RepID=UPI0022400AAA|nr:polyprenyl synthetase family protein [Streptomyces hygroscopicus]MCW7941225.1 polyprenyl diphosphate synthase [Streptomyces hygroscopicus]
MTAPTATGVLGSPRTDADAGRILNRARDLVAPALAESVATLHPWVAEMADYALGRQEQDSGRRQGKGVRQALAVLGAELPGAPATAGVPAAVAVELVHTFSLLHDDIMDGDALRRGRPALWKAYGTGPAVLAGDALFALAVQTLSTAPAAVRRLTVALGDLVHGQADDLLFADRPWTGPESVSIGEYEAMAERKTGALLGCALALGAHFGGARDETASALDRAGRHLGVGFQIVDDLLGIWGDPDVTGKPVHSDLREGKKTLPVLVALDTTRGPELAELLAARDDSGVRRAAAAVAEAGGRATALRAARRHLAAANSLLDSVPCSPRPAAELRTLVAALSRRTV